MEENVLACCLGVARNFLVGSWDVSRAVLIWPSYKHDANASGDFAYVMAGGPAYFERLRAASDLYHWDRTKTIVILDEEQGAGYDVVKRKRETRVELAKRYLKLFGVPESAVLTVKAEENIYFGSFSEAIAVSREFPDAKDIIVVTSAPHTRRSHLCSSRVYPDNTKIAAYSASLPAESDELFSPIWLEYFKLAIYWCAAG